MLSRPFCSTRIQDVTRPPMLAEYKVSTFFTKSRGINMRSAIPFLLLLAFAYQDEDAYGFDCTPCLCDVYQKTLEVFCFTKDPDSLMSVFDGLKEQNLSFSLLTLTTLTTIIPEGLFKDIEIDGLVLRAPEVNHLPSSTFESQGHEMEGLTIYQSSLTSVPTEALAPLQKLKKLEITDATGLSHIPRLNIPSAKHYTTILLYEDNIKSIADDAFIDFTGLKTFALSRNNLTDISSLVLSKSIRYFDARNNKLSAFPTEALNAISDGAEIDLSYNRIANFSAKDVADIIAKRFELDMRGNPINCNCAFKELADYWGSAPRDLSLNWLGTCREPSSLNGTRLMSLTPSMFRDC